MNFRKVWIYTNSNGNICTTINPFIEKIGNKRRYGIFSSYYNPVTGKYESAMVYELTPKIRSMKAAVKSASSYLNKMAGMLVWFAVTKERANMIAAENGIRLVWRLK